MLLLRLKMSVIVASGLFCSSVFAGGVAENHGLTDLIQRLGAGNEPTGVGVEVAQVEAFAASGGYAPNENDPLFDGKTFNLQSGTSVVSNHATQVGMRIYGTGSSGLAPDVDVIYVYSAEGWILNDYLHVGTSGNPSSPPGDVKLINNSWTASFNNTSTDSQALRRADWSVDTRNVMILNGVANSGNHVPLMSFGFNSVSVGLASGSHTSGVVPAGYDQTGMQIPLIVANQGTTSNATGVVSSVVSLLVETRETHPNTMDNFFATFSETMKAVLLVGGNHILPWTNNVESSGVNRGRTSQPIDSTFGVGTANIDRSHRALTGGQHASSTDFNGIDTAPVAAWETWTLSSNQSRYIKFGVDSLADEVSIALTWHQAANSGFGSYSLVDMDMELYSYENGTLTSLVGDAGLGVFGSGNVVSESAIDNVEHLYIQNLVAGEYVLEIRRADFSSASRVFSVAWLFPEQNNLPGDINGDGVVDVSDILMLIVAWGPCSDCIEDLNSDGIVDVVDLIQLISYW